MNAAAQELRSRRLRALDVEPLRLRTASASVSSPSRVVQEDADATPSTAVVTAIRRLALQPDPAELENLMLRKMYEALTEAVGKAGLQRVRVCDVAADPGAAVMVFGAAALPDGVPPARVLRVDPLALLHGDRERKRLLWEQMQALGRREDG
jgi:hypothetical protein